MASPENKPPRLAGVRYVGDGLTNSAVFAFQFNGVRFSVVAASPEDEAGGKALVPLDYKFEESLEGKILIELSDLSWGDEFSPFDEARDEASERLENQLADMAADVCLTTMQHLAPTPIPAAQTLQDQLYPQTYTLQVLTEGDKLTCRTLNGYAGIAEPHPPVSADKLLAMELDVETTDIPVLQASQVVLVRRLQNFVWRVTVNGEEMVCKSSIDVFKHAIGDELAAYLKIRSAEVELRVPELKGQW
jgi:hypothetical protein